MKRNLVRVYTFNQATHWFIVGLFFPIMVLFLLDKGLDILQAGTVIGVYSAAVVFLELPTGGLADSIGRKRVYLMSIVVHLASIVVLILSWNFSGLLIGFFGIGVGRALSSGTIDAWFVDEFTKAEPNGNLQRALARANIFIPIGIAVGSLVGGLIPMLLGGLTKGLMGIGYYSANLVVMGIALVAQFFLTSLLIVETTGPISRSSALTGVKKFPEIVSTSVKYGIKNRATLVLMIASLALGFGLISIELFWQPRLNELLGENDQTWIFGVLGAAYFFAASLGNILITPLCSRFGNSYSKVLVILRFLLGSFLIILAFQDALLGFVAFFLLFLTIGGMETSPHATIFNSQVPKKRRSTLMSFESFVTQIGVLIGSFFLGFVANTSSIGIAWTVAGIVLITSSITYLILVLKKYDSKGDGGTCAVGIGDDLKQEIIG